MKGDWDTWNARSLKDEPIVRLILDGTNVRVRLDKKATSISLLVVLGVRAWVSMGRPMALALTEYLLWSKRTRQVFETEACASWNSSNRPR